MHESYDTDVSGHKQTTGGSTPRIALDDDDKDEETDTCFIT